MTKPIGECRESMAPDAHAAWSAGERSWSSKLGEVVVIALRPERPSETAVLSAW